MKFTLAYPVKPLIITQKFGEIANLDYYKTNGINFTGHNGVDLRAVDHQIIYAPHDGTAYWEKDDKGGCGVVLVTDNLFDYKDTQAFYKTVLWHAVEDQTLLKKLPLGIVMNGIQGYQVKTGDPILYADNTGLSTATHVHWGLKPMYGRSPFDGLNIEASGGYFGAIDPIPYCDGVFAEDLSFRHTFEMNLHYGQTSPEVMVLQKALQLIGCFPMEVPFSQHYGGFTRNAVFLFQKKFVAPLSWSVYAQVYSLLGSYCGPATRGALNKIFS